MRTLIATSILATLVALGPAWPAAAAAPPEPPAFAPGELLVRFDGGRERLVELPRIALHRRAVRVEVRAQLDLGAERRGQEPAQLARDVLQRHRPAAAR